ncbi:Putative UDP-glucuronosyltransferase ugt-50 [Toxocara canis]|uniref:glucuronosyltransferase n=1 Tax=Toxocara canis TaxID=6265 RepID=A0A0B2W4R0_TOXCA|nr:Putative UDP-glucuronosyltransferase ugt-50 [Toxocara canis]
MGRIADILADSGHDVVVLLPECDKRIKTDGTMLARTIHAPCNFDVLVELLSLLDNIWSINTRRVDFIIHMAWIFSSKENLICNGLLADVGLMRRLKDEKFDLGISEAFSFCGFGVFDKIGLQKHLSAFNTEIFEAFTEPYGISYNPSHVPALLGRSSDMMNFMERLDNFIVFLNTYALTRLVAVPHALQPFEEHIRRPFTIVESIITACGKDIWDFIGVLEPRPNCCFSGMKGEYSGKQMPPSGNLGDVAPLTSARRLLLWMFYQAMENLITACGKDIWDFIGVLEPRPNCCFSGMKGEYSGKQMPPSGNLGDVAPLTSARRLLLWMFYQAMENLVFLITETQKYIPSPQEEILANCPFIFVNTNILFEFPRELNSKIVFVSGISASQSNSLDEDFQRLMDASTGGVVLVSFGTIALSSQMPPDLKSAFVSAFQHFPEITFIWKYELDDEVASDLPNVIKRKWVPQSALLVTDNFRASQLRSFQTALALCNRSGHRNMRAFISHCGTNGLSESVNAGIPMVCVPLFFDQIRSAKKLEKQHTAFIIHKHNLTAQSVQWAIRTILYEKSYSISARRLSAMTKDVMIPLEEQINRHAKVAINMRKVEKLDPSGRRLNYFQFFLVDLTAIPLILIILLGANLCDL